MSRKFRDLYNEKVKGAVPVTEDEQTLFDLAQEEEKRELQAIATVEALAEQKRSVGAPRKTAGDPKLVEQLVKKHGGNVKLAGQEFIKIVTRQDQIQKKRARARFKAALNALKT